MVETISKWKTFDKMCLNEIKMRVGFSVHFAQKEPERKRNEAGMA